MSSQRIGAHGETGAAEQLFAMANEARARAGVPPLVWDTQLTAAARQHCERMVAEGPISHQYAGEPDLSKRAQLAGAHFGLIEENVAVGSYAGQIHESWMNSPGHRRNLLSSEVDHVGISVIAGRDGALYAVADYERAVAFRTPSQVEAGIGELIHKRGLTVRRDPHDARATCMVDHGLPGGLSGGDPGFVMRWQGADLDHLPQALVDRIDSGRYRQADVGTCPPGGDQTAFTQYRVTVLLY